MKSYTYTAYEFVFTNRNSYVLNNCALGFPLIFSGNTTTIIVGFSTAVFYWSFPLNTPFFLMLILFYGFILMLLIMTTGLVNEGTQSCLLVQLGIAKYYEKIILGRPFHHPLTG